MKNILKKFPSIAFCIILCCIFSFSCKSKRIRPISKHGSIVEKRKFAVISTSVKVELVSLYVDNDSIAVPLIDNPPFSSKYMPPRYKDGWRKLVDYLEDEILHPASIREGLIQGRSWVSFCMDKHGHITNIKMLRSIDDSLDKEIIRVIEKIPDVWLPAIKNNEFVDSYIHVCFSARQAVSSNIDKCPLAAARLYRVVIYK